MHWPTTLLPSSDFRHAPLSQLVRGHETAGGSDVLNPSVFPFRDWGMSGMSLDFTRACTLLGLQLELECIRIVDGNRLAPFACPNPDPPSRVVLVRFHDRLMAFVRDDVEASVADRFTSSLPKDTMGAISRVRDFVGFETEWHGSTYVATTPFDVALTAGVTERAANDGTGDRSLVILDGDTVVSGCSSSRENSVAAEAWVWTEERVRRKGLGRRCVAAWANDLLRQGKVPFYSYASDNQASRQLARSLALTWAFDVYGFG